ncbi:MAG: DNA replication and repair protein RecF [Oscillospiraceae bacterium]|nr:DNA replication and repair protein RecF [Oscillospiraceae bacterium]
MILKKIYIKNFRNIKETELDLNPAVNIFYGDNAQGKTNLLEAVSLALGKSFRNIRNSSIIPFNCDNNKTVIKLYYESEHIPNRTNELIYETDGFKTDVKINSIPLNKAADLYGEFKYVIFTPDNLNLIKGYPDVRRYYLDNIAVMQNRAHKKIQYEYKEALKQRCAACASNYFFGDALAVWDDILIKQGINLTFGRMKYLDLIKKSTIPLYESISGGEKLGISYKSDVFHENIDFSDKEKLYEIYKRSLDKTGSEGYANKTPGTHKDDITFTIQGKSARNFGSQGQLRSIAVVLKLAEAELIREFNRERPVVLLDEVLGELDKGRREFVIKHFDNSQVFITSCNINDFKSLPNIKIWRVENGVFTSG